MEPSGDSKLLTNALEPGDVTTRPRQIPRMHIKRENYQALVWYQADQSKPNIPWPEGHGWEIINEKLTTKWSEADLMPQELIGVLVSEDPQEDEDQ